MAVQGIVNLRKLLIIVEKYGLRHVCILRRHGNQFFIIKRDAEVFCQTYSKLPASAAKFPADCDHSIHNIYLPFS